MNVNLHSFLTFERMALLTVLSLSMAACAPVMEHLPSFKKADDYAVAQSVKNVTPVSWPAADWWVVYQDEQLNALMREALDGAPDLAIANARLKQANARAEQAGAVLAPQLALNASYTSMRQSANNGAPAGAIPDGWNDSARGTLDFSYEIDFWGKNRASVAAALSEAEAAKAEAAQARVVLTTSLAEAYADLAQNYADKEAAEAALKVRSKTASLFAQREASGLENIGSVRQARALEANAKAEVAAYNEAIGLTRNRIAALLGKGPDRGLEIAEPKRDVQRSLGVPENLSLDLLARRADVQAARLRAEGAAARIKVAKAGFYPNVNVTAYLGQQVLGLQYLGKGDSTIGGVGPAISLPIFGRDALKGQYKLAGATYEEAVASYDATLTHAYQEVADVVVSRQQLGERLAFGQQAVDDAEKAWVTMRQRYGAGLSNYLDVLSAEDILIQNRKALAGLEARAFKLDIQLMKALGGGYTFDANMTEHKE